MVLMAGCGKPKTIPDDKLEKIFDEIFLANAYSNTVGDRAQMDTADIYRPILKKYGYRVQDLTYTIENYSKRKSKRISDVVESSIRGLENTERYYAELVTQQDTIEARALRLFARTVFRDTTRRQVFSLDDTAKLRIEIPVRPGTYHVEFAYLIDSLDQNGRSAYMFEMLDSARRITNTHARALVTRAPANIAVPVEARPGDRTLRIKLAGYGPMMKRPHVTIDSIRVVYNLPVKEALDSMTIYYQNRIITFPQYADRPDTTSRGTLRADPPWLPEGGDDNP